MTSIQQSSTEASFRIQEVGEFDRSQYAKANDVMNGDDEMAEKKHQVPQVPAPGGGKQDRSRDKNGEWREKRDDAGKPRPKKK